MPLASIATLDALDDPGASYGMFRRRVDAERALEGLAARARAVREVARAREGRGLLRRLPARPLPRRLRRPGAACAARRARAARARRASSGANGRFPAPSASASATGAASRKRTCSIAGATPASHSTSTSTASWRASSTGPLRGAELAAAGRLLMRAPFFVTAATRARRTCSPRSSPRSASRARARCRAASPARATSRPPTAPASSRASGCACCGRSRDFRRRRAGALRRRARDRLGSAHGRDGHADRRFLGRRARRRRTRSSARSA